MLSITMPPACDRLLNQDGGYQWNNAIRWFSISHLDLAQAIASLIPMLSPPHSEPWRFEEEEASSDSLSLNAGYFYFFLMPFSFHFI